MNKVHISTYFILYISICSTFHFHLVCMCMHCCIVICIVGGCLTTLFLSDTQSQNQDLSTFAEVARVPKGCEWLWHPKVISLYNNVLSRCFTNPITREAASGALQNITAGDKRVRQKPACCLLTYLRTISRC